MPRFEVGVREYQHIAVEAESEEEAKEKAKQMSDYDTPEAYQAVELSD